MNLYQRKFELMGPVIVYYPKDDDFYPQLEQEYNGNQNSYINYVEGLISKNKNLWATKIIKQRQAHYYPPELNEYERMMFTRDHF